MSACRAIGRLGNGRINVSCGLQHIGTIEGTNGRFVGRDVDDRIVCAWRDLHAVAALLPQLAVGVAGDVR